MTVLTTYHTFSLFYDEKSQIWLHVFYFFLTVSRLKKKNWVRPKIDESRVFLVFLLTLNLNGMISCKSVGP